MIEKVPWEKKSSEIIVSIVQYENWAQSTRVKCKNLNISHICSWYSDAEFWSPLRMHITLPYGCWKPLMMHITTYRRDAVNYKCVSFTLYGCWTLLRMLIVPPEEFWEIKLLVHLLVEEAEYKVFRHFLFFFNPRATLRLRTMTKKLSKSLEVSKKKYVQKLFWPPLFN